MVVVTEGGGFETLALAQLARAGIGNRYVYVRQCGAVFLVKLGVDDVEIVCVCVVPRSEVGVLLLHYRPCCEGGITNNARVPETLTESGHIGPCPRPDSTLRICEGNDSE